MNQIVSVSRFLKPALFSLPVAALLFAGCGGNEQFAGGNNANGSATGNAASGATLASATEPPSQPGKYGGQLVDVTISNPKTFNYWVSAETSSSGIVGPLYDALLTRNGYTLEWEDSLAELPTISEDNLTWTFKLKENLKWSDGQPLTADDVVFTCDMIYDPKTQGIMREGMLVDEIDPKTQQPVIDPQTKQPKRVPLKYRKIDERTVEFTFPQPYAPARDILTFPVAPRHKLYNAWKAGRINETWNTNTPVKELVGSSAWTISSYVPDQRVIYKRNPYYWKKDDQGRQLPYLDTYVQLIVPNLNTMTLKFKAGQVDVLGVQAPDYPDIKKGEANGNYKVHNLGPGFGFSYLGFNMNPNAQIDKSKVRLFQQQKFRQAVSYAINRELMAKNLFLGLASPMYSPVSPANKVFFNDKAPTYPYDLNKAKALLDEIGVKDTNGNGVREFEGKDVKFNIITNVENDLRKSMCVQITSDLKSIGINAVFTPIAFNKLIQNLDAKPYPWEAVVLGFTGGPEPHNGANVWFSSGPSHQWHPNQKSPATPWEAEIDSIFRKASQTLDEKERKVLYDRWQVIAAEQLPFIFTVVPDSLQAVRNKFGNLKPSSAGGALWNLDEIYDLKATRNSP
jgi:peptide/nickel transport system substrate-binding protein